MSSVRTIFDEQRCSMTSYVAYESAKTEPAFEVLVVDDDEATRKAVSTPLVETGYETHLAANVREAREILHVADPDICILEVLVPGTSGRVFCRELAETRQVGVIIVSSLSAHEDRIALLDLGADDYVVKPFHPQELLARVRAVLRRCGKRTPPSTKFGRRTLNPGDRRVFRDDGSSIALTPGECELLRFLLDNPDIVFSREQLLAVSRGRQHGGANDRSVDTLIKRLRRKLEDDSDGPTLIETVWGRGYRFHPSPALIS